MCEKLSIRFTITMLALAGFLIFLIVNTAPVREFTAQTSESLSVKSWWWLVAVTFLVLVGSVLRTLRTKVILDHAKQGAVLLQFRTLAVGYYFNLVLPLRAGELLRSYLLARQLRISFLYTFVSVALERTLDVILIAILYLTAVAFLGPLPISAWVIFLILSAALALVTLFVLVIRQNKALMAVVWRGTKLFSELVESRLRLSVWSVVHGFQEMLGSRRNVFIYLGYFFASWAAYLSALLILAAKVFPNDVAKPLLVALAPFVTNDALFLQPSFESYSAGVADFFNRADVLTSGAGSAAISGTLWIVLVVPVSLIGLISIFERDLINSPQLGGGDGSSRARVLDRSSDHGMELEAFLDSFFRQEALAKALHQLDVRGEVDLLRFFKGGSDAVTALIREHGGLRVRKLVPLQYQARLENQYVWLQQHQSVTQVVRVLGEQVRDDYYAIDLEYDPSFVSMFSYVHTHSLRDSEGALKNAWDILFDQVYQLGALRANELSRDKYIQERLVARVEMAASMHKDLAEAMSSTLITIANESCLNFHTVMDKIRTHPQAWADLATYQPSAAVHGDLTVDNLLINPETREILFIDPSDDNEIRGPIIDFARHLQSLWGGYEFVTDRVRPPTFCAASSGASATITYVDTKSARYDELARWVVHYAQSKLSPEEVRSLPFHVGLFYGRMLTHRIAIDPTTALIYYAKCVEFLNIFLGQYPTTSLGVRE